MRIAIMGAGGMGGYFGAKLAAAGHDVAFVARGAHLDAMRTHGLRISGAESLHLPRVEASDDPCALAPADLVMFCVKLYDTDTAAAAIKPLLKDGACVLTVQNGIDSAQRIAAQIGPGRTLAGAAYFPANIVAPGEIQFLGAIKGRPLLRFGEADGGDSERVRAIAETMNKADVAAEVSDDSRRMLWEKLCLMAGVSATTTLSRQNVGTVRADPDLRWMLEAAITEAAQVGRALGVPLAADLEQNVLRTIDGNPADGKASTLVDLERGRRLELDGLSGAVLRLGRDTGVATPVHATVYAALKPFIDGE